jgi:hypothetical protein
MILLTATTDKLDLITGTAADLDVHASWMDYASGTVTPGRTNTAITTATTTDIVPAPGASTQKNVKRLNIRNKDSADATDVTVRFNQNGTAFELHKVRLAPGDVLQYIDGVGWFLIESLATRQGGITNANTGDVVANAADTYLAGSALAVGGRLRQGVSLRWTLRMTKTAAGTAAPVYTVRVGTAGTTADTGRLTFTGLAQTAAADTGYHEVEVIIDSYGASGTVRGVCLTSHQNTTTGLQNNAQSQALIGTSPSAHDQTAAGLIYGLSCNPGASGVWTFQVISSRAFGLAA